MGSMSGSSNMNIKRLDWLVGAGIVVFLSLSSFPHARAGCGLGPVEVMKEEMLRGTGTVLFSPIEEKKCHTIVYKTIGAGSIIMDLLSDGERKAQHRQDLTKLLEASMTEPPKDWHGGDMFYHAWRNEDGSDARVLVLVIQSGHTGLPEGVPNRLGSLHPLNNLLDDLVKALRTDREGVGGKNLIEKQVIHVSMESERAVTITLGVVAAEKEEDVLVENHGNPPFVMQQMYGNVYPEFSVKVSALVKAGARELQLHPASSMSSPKQWVSNALHKSTEIIKNHPVLATAAVAGVACPVAIPFVVSGAGFTSAGIAAGSWAATFMSTYGGIVGSGSACAALQSIGTAGLATKGVVAASTVGAAAGAGMAKAGAKLGRLFREGNQREGEGKPSEGEASENLGGEDEEGNDDEGEASEEGKLCGDEALENLGGKDDEGNDSEGEGNCVEMKPWKNWVEKMRVKVENWVEKMRVKVKEA